MDIFFEQLINGLTLGSIYALIALGYTMVYGILRLINFAHGDLFALGAYVGFTLLGFLFGSEFGAIWLILPVIAIGAAVPVVITSLVIERAAYRPLRTSHRLTIVVSALGAARSEERRVGEECGRRGSRC